MRKRWYRIFIKSLPEIAIVLLLSLGARADEVLSGSCHQGSCVWIRLGTPEVVKSDGSESLKRVKVVNGGTGDGESRESIKWADHSEDVYALCSKTRPAIVYKGLSDKGKWTAQFLAPGYGKGVYNAILDLYIEYFKIYHNMAFLQWDNPDFREKLGYPPELVSRVSALGKRRTMAA